MDHAVGDLKYRVFIKYCGFFLKIFVIFLNSASSAAALVFYLPGVCAHQGKTEKGKSPKYFKIFEKNHNI